MLDNYKNQEDVMSVTSYSYPEKTLEIDKFYNFDNYFTGDHVHGDGQHGKIGGSLFNGRVIYIEII